MKLFDDWAYILDNDGRQLEAQRIYRRALDISRNDESNNAVAPVLLFNYATLLKELGKTTESARYFALASKKAHELNDNVLVDDIDLLQADMFIDAHAFAQSAHLLDEVEQRMHKRYDPAHYVFAEVSSERARIALSRGDLPSAAHFASKAVEIDEASIRRIGQCAALLPYLLMSNSESSSKAVNGSRPHPTPGARSNFSKTARIQMSCRAMLAALTSPWPWCSKHR